MERQWAQQDVLSSPQFAEAVKTVSTIKATADFRFCLIGGLAVAHYVNPPVTVDVDFLCAVSRTKLSEIAALFRRKGWSIIPLRFTVQLRGFPKFGYIFLKEDLQIDLLATDGDEYLDSVVWNAKQLASKLGVLCPVARAEDIVVLKTMAGREKDSSDVLELYKKLGHELDNGYIERTLDRLL